MTCAQGLLRLLWGGGPKLECYGTERARPGVGAIQYIYIYIYRQRYKRRKTRHIYIFIYMYIQAKVQKKKDETTAFTEYVLCFLRCKEGNIAAIRCGVTQGIWHFLGGQRIIKFGPVELGTAPSS